MILRIYVVVAYVFMVFINLNVNCFFMDKVKLQVTSKPFKFGYVEGNYLNMDLRFKLPPDATAGCVTLRYNPTDARPRSTFEIVKRPYDETDDLVANVHDYLWSKHVYLDVHLYNNNGVRILNERISEGVELKSVQNPKDLGSTYSMICIFGQKCDVEADLRHPSEVEEERKKNKKDTPKLQVTSEPFKFGYIEGNYLKMDLSFKLSPDVTSGYVTLRYSTTGSNYKNKFEIRRHDGTADPVAEVRSFTLSEHVYIDVHLYNKNGVRIFVKRISEGAAVQSVRNSNGLDSTYSLSCLQGQKCDVEADLRIQTEGENEMKQNEKGEEERKQKKVEEERKQKKVEEERKRKQTVVAERKKTEKDAADNKETTTISSFNRIKGAETVFDSTKETETINKYVILIICLSVFIMAMFLLAIALFTKSCSFKRDTPEILQLPIQKMNPFYANLLFRKECQEIIDDLEQNQYELIDPFERR